MNQPRIGRPPIDAEQATIARGVRLLSSQWDVVEQVAASIGERGVSAGLREIITQWLAREAQDDADIRSNAGDG